MKFGIVFYLSSISHILYMHFNTYSQGKIQVGSRALPWELYRDLNMEMFKLGTGEAITGVAFAKATVNLACRGDSTGQICTKHLAWGGDSFGIPFTHEKRNQQGEDPLMDLVSTLHLSQRISQEWFRTVLWRLG